VPKAVRDLHPTNIAQRCQRMPCVGHVGLFQIRAAIKAKPAPSALPFKQVIARVVERRRQPQGRIGAPRLWSPRHDTILTHRIISPLPLLTRYRPSRFASGAARGNAIRAYRIVAPGTISLSTRPSGSWASRPHKASPRRPSRQRAYNLPAA